MKIEIRGKDIRITDGLRDAAEYKIGKLSKFVKKDETVEVIMSRDGGGISVVEISVMYKGKLIRVEEAGPDMYALIGDAVDSVIRQFRKYKTYLEKRKRGQAESKTRNIPAADDAGEQFDPQIMRVKRFDIKPMFPEDAVLEMELLSHNFYVFLNAETEEVNVAYRRKKGGYGLIGTNFDPGNS